MDEPKTSIDSWVNSLRRTLSSSRKPAWIGVGQELRGDDAAGLLVIRKLISIGTIKGARANAPLFVEAGPLPESATGPLRRYAADLAIFVDAADLGAAPGTIAWLTPDDITGVSALSHALPLSTLFCVLQQELGCDTAILGIQPAQMEFDTSPSGPILGAVERMARLIWDEIELRNA
jgi:hydrogenase 3 maturation protease